VCAASPCELLELEKPALEALASSYPRIRRVLEEFVAARTTSEDAARIRGCSASPAAGS
jgi:CRP-like cAMP-binding protein